MRAFLDACTEQQGGENGEIPLRFIQHHLMNGAPLDFVAVEKRLPTPALKHRSDFPTQIDRIRDPEVHAEAAKGRVKMAGIACQEAATLLVTISTGTTGFPDTTPTALVGQVDTGRSITKRHP